MNPEISNPPTPDQLKKLGFGLAARMGMCVLNGLQDIAAAFGDLREGSEITDIRYVSTDIALRRITQKTDSTNKLEFSSQSIFPGVM